MANLRTQLDRRKAGTGINPQSADHGSKTDFLKNRVPQMKVNLHSILD